MKDKMMPDEKEIVVDISELSVGPHWLMKVAVENADKTEPTPESEQNQNQED